MKTRKRMSRCLAVLVGFSAILAGNFYAADQKSKANFVAKVMGAEESIDLVVPVGESALFQGPTNNGSKYQWVKNSKRIAGATNSSYSINAVTREDVGFYAVLVTSGSEYPEDVISCTATLFTYAIDPKGRIEASAPFSGPGYSMKSNPGVITNSTGPLNPTGGTIPGCPGTYAGYVKFKNPSGSYWWTRPAGTTQCTITDQSSYTTRVQIVESGTLMSWCNTETVTAPAQPLPRKYQFTTYFTGINPPYSGDPITLLINWNP